MTQPNIEQNTIENIENNKRQEVIQALKEGKENAQELLEVLLVEKESMVKESEDPSTAAIELNVFRARLYFEVGTNSALEEAFNSYEDAIEQAHHEDKDGLEAKIIAEEEKYFGKSK
jgi:hypothetical protein